MTLKGESVFSTRGGAFARFLSDVGSSDDVTHAFVARNFLLDESVPTARADSYATSGAAQAHAAYAAWLEAHKRYLCDHVFRPSLDHGPPPQVDSDDAASCPETFRVPASSPFSTAHGALDLVRVEAVSFVASKSGWSRGDVLAAARAALGPRATDEARASLDALFEAWTLQIELRPVFAAFWDDVEDVFGATPAHDPRGWADDLRDRLGLAHHDPGATGGPIDVLVLRYRVDVVPTLRSVPGTRPLLPPTVLDGSHSPAFCPAPRDSLTGHTLDLGARGARPCREVLHPCARFQARHLFRAGTIARPVDGARLREGRELHLLQVRELSGRPEYATGTDGDLA